MVTFSYSQPSRLANHADFPTRRRDAPAAHRIAIGADAPRSPAAQALTGLWVAIERWLAAEPA
jgi:hypothetical protein